MNRIIISNKYRTISNLCSYKLMVKCWQAMHMHSRSDHANLEHVSQRIAILEHMLQRVAITATQIAKSYYLITRVCKELLLQKLQKGISISPRYALSVTNNSLTKLR